MKEQSKKKIVNFIKWLFLDFSGFYFIKSKVSKPNSKLKQSPSTLLLWLIGIYVAFFGVASNRYENRIDIIENRANSIFAQLATDAYKKALGRIPTVQDMECPEKPEILNPLSVFRSLFKKAKYDEMVNLLIETIEDWKERLDDVNLRAVNLVGARLAVAKLQRANLAKANLAGANLAGAELWRARLWRADLRGANLAGANLMIADLEGADLRRAILMFAKLQEAKLWGANLRGAYLRGADLGGADLREANLQGAILWGARLEKAENLTADQLCEAKTLYQSVLDPELKKEVKEKCPQLLEKPKE